MSTHQARLGELTSRIGNASRKRDHRDLAAVVARDDFLRGLLELPAPLRLTVLETHARAWAKCEAKAPRVPKTKARVSWVGNEMLLARLRKLAPLYDDDVELALAMGQGLSATQVSRARLRFVGKAADATVNDMAKAA